MEFLTATELEVMKVDDLAVYRSLLEQVFSLESFAGSEIGSKLGEVRDLIVKKLTAQMDNYFVNGSKYQETGMVIKTDNIFGFLDDVSGKLIEAGEKNDEEEKIVGIEEQKKAFVDRLVKKYISESYPMEYIVKTLGREAVLKLLDQKTLSKLVGGLGEEKAPVNNGERGNRAIVIEH